MAGVSKAKLSGSTDGRQIKIVATASAGTLVHTAVLGVVAGTLDEIWLYGSNSAATAQAVVVQFGGTTSPDDQIQLTLAPQSGLVLLLPGLVLQNGTVVRVYAAAANVVMVSGYVNAVTA